MSQIALMEYLNSNGIDLTKKEMIQMNSHLSTIDCLNEEEFENAILQWLFENTFELPLYGVPIDLLTTFIDCFGIPNAAGDFLDCSTFSGTIELTLYVDQPVPGSSASYTSTYPPQVGHTFLGLNVTNNGSTSEVVFGYYPSTPTNPITNSSSSMEIRNDGGHPYNVSTTISISCTEFNALANEALGLSTSNSTYDLNTYNCTDFAIETINNTLGLGVPETHGSWPGNFSGGSNPGNLGQDLLSLANPSAVLITTPGSAPPTSCP